MTINITTLLTNQVNNQSLYHQCNWHDTTNFYSEDDYCTGYRNVSHCQQQSFTQGYDHPDDHALSTYEMTPGFKPFTVTSCDITCNNYCIMYNQIYCYFTLQLLYYLKLKMIVGQPREKWLFWMLFNLASKFSWKWKKLNGHNFFRFYNKIVWICYSLFCIMMTRRKTSKQQQTRQGEKRLKGKCRIHVVKYSIKVLIREWYQFALQQNPK